MNTMCTRSQFDICQESVMNVQDVPNGSVSLCECFGKKTNQALKGIRDVDVRQVARPLSVNAGEREIFVIQNATTV